MIIKTNGFIPGLVGPKLVKVHHASIIQHIESSCELVFPTDSESQGILGGSNKVSAIKIERVEEITWSRSLKEDQGG